MGPEANNNTAAAMAMVPKVKVIFEFIVTKPAF